MNVVDLGGRVVRRGRAIRSRLVSRYFVSLGTADPDIIFIAGTGRSGTTWLAELLVRSSRRRLVFEPFRNDRVPEWRDAATRQYIRPEDSGSPFFEPARRILDHGFRNEWADYYNERFLTRGRIVKDIRANLMLRWLYEQFGPFPIVYLVRHPGAVAASWRREGWEVSPVEEFLSQERLVEDFLKPFVDEIAGAEDQFDRLIHAWAIETYVVLRQLSGTQGLTVLYESLILDPVRELARVAEFCSVRASRALSRIDAPSVTSSPGVGYRCGAERLRRWQGQLTAAEIDRIDEIAQLYGLGDIYRRDGTPHKSGSAAL